MNIILWPIQVTKDSLNLRSGVPPELHAEYMEIFAELCPPFCWL